MARVLNRHRRPFHYNVAALISLPKGSPTGSSEARQLLIFKQTHRATLLMQLATIFTVLMYAT